MFKRVLLATLIFCSLTIDSSAQVQWRKYFYWNNIGGLNDQVSTTEIADNEATDLQNIVFDTSGAIKKRFGTLTIPNNPVRQVATGSITSLAFFKQDNGNRYLIAILNDDDNKITVRKKDYESGGGWINTTGWDLIEALGMPSGYSDNNLADYAIASDSFVFAFDVAIQSKPYEWSGSICALLTSDADCPVATILEYHKNILFLSGNDSFPSRVYFSNLDNIRSYTTTDFFDCATSDGTRIRGLVSALNSLYVFKDKSIWRLSGTDRDSFILEKMVEGIGTLSQQSIAVVNNTIFFTTAQNDIAAYDGGYNVVFVSQKIRNTIGGLNFSRATNNLGIGFSTYRYNDYDYYSSVSYAGSGTNNRILFFDTTLRAWSKFVGINANAWCVAEDSLGKNILIYGDVDGYVHYYPSSNYYDTNVQTNAINAFYQTKWFKYPEIALGDKYWRILKTYSLTEDTDTWLTTEVRSDYEASGKILNLNISGSGAEWDVAVWDVDTWGGQGLIVNRSEVEKGTNMFQIRYSNEDVNEGFTILGFEIFLESTDRI